MLPFILTLLLTQGAGCSYNLALKKPLFGVVFFVIFSKKSLRFFSALILYIHVWWRVWRPLVKGSRQEQIHWRVFQNLDCHAKLDKITTSPPPETYPLPRRGFNLFTVHYPSALPNAVTIKEKKIRLLPCSIWLPVGCCVLVWQILVQAWAQDFSSWQRFWRNRREPDISTRINQLQRHSPRKPLGRPLLCKNKYWLGDRLLVWQNLASYRLSQNLPRFIF